MNKSVFALCLAALTLAFASCNTHQQELDQAIRQNDSLTQLLQTKDAEFDSLITVMNQIEENLAAVNARYNTVQQLRREGIENQPNVKSQINAQMKDIEGLLADNKAKLASLQARLASGNKESSRLQELVSRQEERIAAQESQIAELLTELENNKVLISKLNQDVNDLSASNAQKDEYIRRQTSEANRAYYVVGSFNDLKQAGIVGKFGGFIGIGRRQGTVSDMALDRFTQIDLTKVTTIPINMKRVVVVSKHPENSYELVMDENDPRTVSYLRILNPAKFWEQTRFLVVSTK